MQKILEALGASLHHVEMLPALYLGKHGNTWLSHARSGREAGYGEFAAAAARLTHST
jgi:hypothetical protein